MGINRGSRPASLGAAFAGALVFTAQAAQAMDIFEPGAANERKGAAEAAGWTGFYLDGQFYLGGHLGGAWASSGLDMTRGESAASSASDEVLRDPVWHGFGFGGARAGYNWSDGQIVYGFEGDLRAGARESVGADGDYLASLRGRLGLVSDSWLFYGTIGAAFAGNGRDAAAEPKGAPLPMQGGGDQAGFVIGGGIEGKLSPSLSVGLEGMHYGFDAGPREDRGALAGSGAGANSLSDVTVLRGRLTLRLDSGPEPLK